MNQNSRCFYIVSWNVRGLGDSDKCGVVRDVFTDAKPSIICLQETKLDTINLFKAKAFLPINFSSSYVFAPTDGTRGEF
jgi:exonuclease III